MTDINLIVSLSNLFAAPAIYMAMKNEKHALTVISVVSMLASMLMHLSETKHGLPGISPLARYSYLFLQIDRGISIVSILYSLSIIVYLPDTVFGYTFFNALIGLLLLAYSESLVGQEYAAPHIAWHVIAYHTLYVLAKYS